MIRVEDIFNCLLAFAAVWIIKSYLDHMFVKRKKIAVYKYLMWIALFALQFWQENQKGAVSIPVLAGNICLVAFLCIYIYQGGFYKSILYATLLYAMWMVSELSASLIIQLVPLEIEPMRLLGSIFSKIVMFILLTFLKIFLHNKLQQVMEIKYWLLLFLVPISSIWISYHILLLDQSSNKMSTFTIITYFLILFINLIIFDVCTKMSENLELQKESAVFEQQLELIEKYSAERENEIFNVKRLQHDLKGHLNYLREQFKQNNSEKGMAYIDDLLDEFTIPIKAISKSGNMVIDSLINFRCSNAQKAGVTIQTNICIPRILPEEIKEKDICIILGNALDNAIEAAVQCEENKWIKIAIAYKKQAISMVIQNSYRGEVRKNSKGNLLTTKKDSANHGLGLSSIRKAVEKYSGEMIIEEKDGIFGLTILLLLDCN